MKNEKRFLVGLFLAAGLADMLAGGIAAAMPSQCSDCEPCGCATNGGYILCCKDRAC